MFQDKTITSTKVSGDVSISDVGPKYRDVIRFRALTENCGATAEDDETSLRSNLLTLDTSQRMQTKQSHRREPIQENHCSKHFGHTEFINTQ